MQNFGLHSSYARTDFRAYAPDSITAIGEWVEPARNSPLAKNDISFDITQLLLRYPYQFTACPFHEFLKGDLR